MINMKSLVLVLTIISLAM